MSGSKSKIVSLNTGTARRAGAGSAGGHDGGATDPVSAVLLRLHERVKPVLMRSVQSLFDQADDALFELADKAGSNGEQNLYFESMRELRIRRRGVELALGRDLQESLRSFARGNPLPTATHATGVEELSADSLALVTNDELEERVAIDSMVTKAEKEFASLLTAISARLQALMPHLHVDPRSNPLGPASLCESFLAATRDVRLDIKARLVLFKLFDRFVVSALGDFYRLADRQLADEGINPTAAKPQRSSYGGSGATPGGATGQASSGDAEQFFTDLQQLLEGNRNSSMDMAGARQGLVAPGLAPALPRDALLQLLSELQRQQLLSLATRQQSSAQPLDVLRSISDVLQQRLPGQAVSIGQVDDDAINLVSMLFQFVLEDRNLAAPVKGLIARLQIPILKVAMVDKSFFSKGGHPARKLLNELANASLGWAPLGDVERDPFYRRVEEAVALVVNEYMGDVAVFEKALGDFSSYVELERRRAALVEQRTIDAEDGRARSELARRRVDAVLSERTAGRSLPPVVGRLLNEGWSNVLFLVCLKEGAESDEWRQAVRTVDDLIASVVPVSGFDARAQLLQLLPSLLKRLRLGLSKVGVSPYDLETMFDELERIHLDRLHSDEVRGLLADPTEPAPAATAESAGVAAPAAAAETSNAVDVPMLTDVVGVNLQAPLARGTVDSPDDLLPDRAAATPAAADLASLERELTAALGEESLTLDEDNSPDVDPVASLTDDAAAAGAQAGKPASDPQGTSDAPVFAAETGANGAQPAPTLAEALAAELGGGTAADPSASVAAGLARIDRLQVGGWVELHQSENRTVRCRLAAIIRATGKFIFVNRAGAKVAENTREGLAHLFSRGELTILDEGRLFDRALESVIGNLREMRERN